MTTRIVAVGNGTNTIAYSDDYGETWTGLGTSKFTNKGYAVAFSKEDQKFIAVGQTSGNKWAYKSGNGITWNKLTNTIFSNGRAIATYKGRWIAAGQGTNASIAYSDDVGETWTKNLETDAIFNTRGQGLANYGNKWVAAGKGNNHSIAYSHNNGDSWLAAQNIAGGNTDTIFSTEGFSVATNGSRWLAGGKGINSLAYSDDNGINWQGIDSSLNTAVYSILWTGTHFIIGGEGVRKQGWSTDGLNWTYLQPATIKNRYNILVDGRVIAFGNPISGGGNSIAYSDDNGLTWTGAGSTVITSVGRGGAASGPKPHNGTIAVGQGINTIAYSDDNGLTWTGLGKTIFSTKGLFIAWNHTKLVAVGSGTNSIAYSSDGTNWVPVSNSTNIFTEGNGIAWSSKLSRWVAVGSGDNTIAYSNDNGLTWTGIGKSIFETTGYRIAWNGFRFVAVGNGATTTIAYSDDGISWTAVANSKTLFSSFGVGISSIGTRWIAVGVGSANTIAYSNDNGVNWTGLGKSIFSLYGIAVAYNGSQLVATGGGTNTIAYSSDGINWTAVTNSTSIFSVIGNGIVWNDTRWVAVGNSNVPPNSNGGNSIAYSTDGISWTNVTDSGTIFSAGGFSATGYQYPARPIPTEPKLYTTNMPIKIGPSEQGHGFTLGRRAFLKNIHESHIVSNLSVNNSSVLNPKPISGNSSDLRIQRLRLSTIGGASTKLNKATDQLILGTADSNYVTNVLRRARGGGARAPKR